MTFNIQVSFAEVVSVLDDTDGKRIKARLIPEDNHLSNEELPYAFPFLPKIIHIHPKVGETVFILHQENRTSLNRFYMGPVISQPQMMNHDPFNFSSLSLFPSSEITPDKAPSRNPNVQGSLPDQDDIAIEGRQNSDIIFKDNEVQIRCGKNKNPLAPPPTNLFFNSDDPAYIQLKYRKDKEVASSINIVADKINILSHDSVTKFNLTDKEKLINDDELKKILDEAHRLPYGDVLVEFLTKFMNAFLNHTHPFSMDSPVKDGSVMEAANFNLQSLLSESVRIN